MKLLLSLTLFWALSSTGGALVCQTCTNQACSTTDTVACSSGMCITASIQAILFGTPGLKLYKACAASSMCPNPGPQTFSVNFGAVSALGSATCCNTDNCNSANLSAPAAGSPNGLQCFICDPITFLCNTTVQCKGKEDRCFQATVASGSTTLSAHGCASANVCGAASTCCSKNLCNIATVPNTTTAAATTTVPNTTTAAATTTVPNTTTAAATTTVPNITTAAITTTVPNATTAADPTTTNSTSAAAITTANDACCMSMIHLLIGLLVSTVY